MAFQLAAAEGAPAANFCHALEKAGGLYATFGHFLTWRADLLRADYLLALRSIRVSVPPVPRADVVRALCNQLGLAGERVAASLSDEPLWSTVSRCAWRGTHEGRPVVVQYARPPVTDAEFRRFAGAVTGFRDHGTAAALTPEVLKQFEAWVRIPESAGRERTYLETLASFPQKMQLEYPRPIPELCSEDFLCWDWVEGKPVGEAPNASGKLAEAILEQFCLVSVVDAEVDFSAIIVKPDGRLAMRRANRLVAIPAAMTRSVLKYVSSVLSGNSPYANHQLVRLALGYSSSQLEARLYDELSNLEPELKINLSFPESAGVFESNWRALARLRRERPLFVDMLHRNLEAVGYLDADGAKPGIRPDVLTEAQWPVIGRLLRTRISEITTGDVGNQWVMGSGLLMLEGMRQVTRLADGFRDNDLAFTFSQGLWEEGSYKSNRMILTGVVLTVLLTIFLICLRWGPTAPAPWSGVVAGVAVISAVAALWLLSRIE